MGDNKGEQGKYKVEKEGDGKREEEWQKYVTWQFCIHTHSHVYTRVTLVT